VLEVYVSIFCVCMPALRRFLKRFFPVCFGSTAKDSNYRKYATPEPNKLSNRNISGPRKARVSYPDKTIMKTSETRVETGMPEDDEIELMDARQQKKANWSSNTSAWSHQTP